MANWWQTLLNGKPKVTQSTFGCKCCCYWSVAKLGPTLCDPYGLQHARLLCPPLSSRVRSNSCPLGQWCYLNISSSAALFSCCPQSFPGSGSFPVCQLFTSGGQSIRASASATVLPMNIPGWFPLELIDLISLQPKGLSRVFSNTTVQKHQFFGTQLVNQSDLSHLFGLSRPWQGSNGSPVSMEIGAES